MTKIPAMWAHQKEAVEKARLLPGYALFFEMGSGKSRTTLEILKDRFNHHGRVLRTIIVCPPLVIPNWKDEWVKYTKIDPKKVIPLYGTGPKRLKTFLQYSHNSDERIFITNYETLLMQDVLAAFQEWAPEAVVFDESHKCKSHTAQRSKRAYDLANPWDPKLKIWRPKPLTYILSGSPILNSPMDIFMQFKILDGGKSLGSNYWAFRARFFRDRNSAMPKDRYFPKWEIMTKEKDNHDALGELNEIIFSRGMRVEKKDCLDLPPELSVPVKVGMSQDQARLYKEMKNDFVTYYNSKACVASLAITKALRLLQITAGFVALEDKDMAAEAPNIQVQLGDTPKLKALAELIQEITEQGQKVLVWAVWKHNYAVIKQVCEELGVGSVEVHGGVSEAAKREAVEKFKTDPEVKVFIGHPGSGGIGINLVNAAYSIFYSRTFSLENYLQAKARNHRGGSKEAGHTKITHYDLICENTIDELVVKALTSKQEIGAKLLGDMVLDLGDELGKT